MAFGRPTKYSEEVLVKSLDYLAVFESEKKPDGWREVVPTVVGLCRFINRSKATVYDWQKHEDKKDFSDILCQIEELQHSYLVNGGLMGEYNPAITKMMLTKHGYSDKVEQAHTSPDRSMSPQHPTYTIAKTDDE